jgi:hypothetical protein
MMIRALAIIAALLIAAPATAQNVKLIDPFTGKAYRVGGAPDSGWQYAGVTGGLTTTADTVLAAAPTATGVRNYLTSLQLKNTSAVASEIVVKDGSTVIWRGQLSASMTFMEIITFSSPLRSSANAALNIALVTTGTATVVSAQGFVGP